MYDAAYEGQGGEELLVNRHGEGEGAHAQELAQREREGSKRLWGLSPTQLAVLEPPYAARVDRPVLVPDSGPGAEEGTLRVQICSRSAEKKAFDQSVFRSKYF